MNKGKGISLSDPQTSRTPDAPARAPPRPGERDFLSIYHPHVRPGRRRRRLCRRRRRRPGRGHLPRLQPHRHARHPQGQDGGAVRAALNATSRAASAVAPQTPASAVSSACTSTQKRRYMLYQPRSRGGATGPRFAPAPFGTGSNRGFGARPRGATRGARARARVRVRAKPSRCRLPSAVCLLADGRRRRRRSSRALAASHFARRAVWTRRPAPNVPEPVRRARAAASACKQTAVPPARSKVNSLQVL